MDKIKKIWKELSIFGVVVVAFVCLLAYRNIAYSQITYVTPEKIEAKVEAKDSFTVVVGMSSETDSTSYESTLYDYVNEFRDEKVYYVDLYGYDLAVPFVMQTFDTDNITLPQTFVVENGEVVNSQTGPLSFYELAKLLGK